jgi:hypothetical protein
LRQLRLEIAEGNPGKRTASITIDNFDVAFLAAMAARSQVTRRATSLRGAGAVASTSPEPCARRRMRFTFLAGLPGSHHDRRARS